MRLTNKPLLLSVSGISIVALLVGAFFAFHGNTRAASAKNQTITQAALVGSTSFSAQPSATTSGASTTNEFAPDVGEEIPRSGSIVHVSASNVPNPTGNNVVSDATAPGFSGLTHMDQHQADNGNQWSLEPPDQGLCVGGNYVVESVNDAVAAYDKTGAMQGGVMSLNKFFQMPSAIVRATATTPAVFGPFVSDPKCYFDVDTNRWFLTVLEIDTNPSTGAFGPRAYTYIAVSQTASPLGKWSIYRIDATDDGQNGTPSHPNCPCLGDQPLIGADANGFYVSTNEFGFATGFNGAQLYAMSKKGLESGKTTTVVHIDASQNLISAGGLSYSIQPATAPAGQYETANGGTEYFLSALDFNAQLDNRVAVWALTNTSSLTTSSPALSLSDVVIGSETYGQPPDAQQKNGPMPLGAAVHNPLELLAGNDDRMNQVVFADGKLWSAVNSVVQTPNSPTRVGAAYFIVSPSDASGTLSASMANQGYVSVNGENVLFPSIGVNAKGQGVMTFTLVGPGYYPSAAYAKIDATNGAGDVHIAAAGAGPEDGFTGYRAFGGGGTARWGDYSAAVADADGSIWFAIEYIPNAPRTLYANWGTFVGHVQP